MSSMFETHGHGHGWPDTGLPTPAVSDVSKKRTRWLHEMFVAGRSEFGALKSHPGLLGARTLLGAPGIVTRNKKLRTGLLGGRAMSNGSLQKGRAAPKYARDFEGLDYL